MNNENILLSICIPTYNRKNLLKLTIDSIVQQLNVNWKLIQIIVTDNNSDDGTDEMLSHYIENYSSICYYKNKENIGAVNNMEKGISYAEGDYVWVVGSDDILVENSIEKVLDIIKDYQNIDLIFLNSYYYLPHEQENLTSRTDDIKNKKIKTIGKADGIYPISHLTDTSNDAFTSIYTIIMNRYHWQNAFQMVDKKKQSFDSAINCIPHAFYITKYMFDRKAYYSSTPLILASVEVGWQEYIPLYVLQYLPDLHEEWRKFGLPNTHLAKVNNYLVESFSLGLLFKLMLTPYLSKNFSTKKFFQRIKLSNDNIVKIFLKKFFFL